MDTRAFDEFVSRQQERPPETASINWKEQRDEWLTHLDRLYSRIESFLSKYAASGQVRYEYRTIELNEEYIGSYQAKQMLLRIGRQEVDLIPVGTLLIGSKGRVDVSGPAGKAQLVLVDSKASSPKSLIHVTVGANSPVPRSEQPRNIQWEWKIVTRPPERRFIEFTQETFFTLILEVANG